MYVAGNTEEGTEWVYTCIARHIKDSFVGLLIESIVWFNCRLEKKE